MAAFGIGAFRLYAFAGDPASSRHPVRIAFGLTLSRAMTVSAAIGLLSSLAMVPCVAAEMTAMPSAALDPLILKVVLVATVFGHLWCLHCGFEHELLDLCPRPMV